MYIPNIYDNNYLKTCSCRARHINKQEQVRGQILIRLTSSKIILCLNTIKMVVFAKKDAHRYKNTTLQKSATHGFAGTVKACVFVFAVETT